MKSLEDLRLLRNELKAAYETVLNNEHTKYDNATVAYALKCYQDAEKTLTEANIKLASLEVQSWPEWKKENMANIFSEPNIVIPETE